MLLHCQHDCCGSPQLYDTSLAWPDPLHTGAYQLLEIISAMLQESGIVHRPKVILALCR